MYMLFFLEFNFAAKKLAIIYNYDNSPCNFNLK